MAPTSSRPWPPPSTADRARRSVGERLPRLSTPCCDPVRLPRLSTPCCDPVRLVLRRPIESGVSASDSMIWRMRLQAKRLYTKDHNWEKHVYHALSHKVGRDRQIDILIRQSYKEKIPTIPY